MGVILIHGGAGTISPETFNPIEENEFHQGLACALKAGAEVMNSGESALKVAVECVVALENHPLFNAGLGAVVTAGGGFEMDASVMASGRPPRAGAVSACKKTKHPILLAHQILESSPHIYLSGEGADEFAKECELELVENEFFKTKKRWGQYLKAIQKDEVVLDHDMGTVGAVVLDDRGELAAATSTGGMTNKARGRVGDSACIGAGTWADKNIAVSTTGKGEAFLLANAARSLSLYCKELGMGLEASAARVLDEVLQCGGHGGLIAINSAGEVCAPFNSKGMLFGQWRSHGECYTHVFDRRLFKL